MYDIVSYKIEGLIKEGIKNEPMIDRIPKDHDVEFETMEFPPRTKKWEQKGSAMYAAEQKVFYKGSQRTPQEVKKLGREIEERLARQIKRERQADPLKQKEVKENSFITKFKKKFTGKFNKKK
jgi:vacuolar-type H+-ATPase subunit I/STV1